MKNFVLTLIFVLGSIVTGHGQVIESYVSGYRFVKTPVVQAGENSGMAAAAEIYRSYKPGSSVMANVFVVGTQSGVNLRSFVGLSVKANGRWIKLWSRKYAKGKVYSNPVKTYSNGLKYAEVVMRVSEKSLIDLSTNNITSVQAAFIGTDGTVRYVNLTNSSDCWNLSNQCSQFLRHLFNDGKIN